MGSAQISRVMGEIPPHIPLHTCAPRGPPGAPLVCSSRSSHRARAAPLVCSSRSSQRARAAPLVCSSRCSQRARAAQCTHFPEVAATAAERPRSPFSPGFPRAPAGTPRFPQHVLQLRGDGAEADGRQWLRHRYRGVTGTPGLGGGVGRLLWGTGGLGERGTRRVEVPGGAGGPRGVSWHREGIGSPGRVLG